MPLNAAISQMFAKMVDAGRPALSAGTPADARNLTAAGRAALGKGPEMHEVKDLTLPSRGGPLRARLLRPTRDVEGLVVYLHGGGWVIGEIDDYDTMARTLAARSGCAVLLPDYRLAPEHPFPAGLQDAEDALIWAAANVQALVGAPVPLLVAGDSAGGNLATVALLALHDRVPVAGQVLVYPVTDADFNRGSYGQWSEGMQLTRADMEWFFNHYAPSDLHAHPRISPMRHANPPKLPPTVVFTAECDVLCDEGLAYAAHLSAGGTEVATRRMESLPHGFIRLHNLVDAADAAVSAIAADLARLARGARA
ncbi:MAG: alpha/beta hydrolase [Pseudomonadota bacterium]